MNAPSPIPLEAYKRLVGTTVGQSNWFDIDQERVNQFASLTCDEQFIHVDPVKAKSNSPFDGTIAHGFLTLSMLTHFSEQAVPEISEATTKVNYGLNKVRFIHPVATGSKIRGVFQLVTLTEPKPKQVDLIWNATIEIQNNDKPALVAEWIARLFV